MSYLVSRRKAFTLVELLVVIAIIGILVALLLPAIQAAREAARRTECNNKIKQIGLALQNYHDTYKILPPGGLANVNTTTAIGNCLGWTVLVLPFLEMQALHDQVNFRANTGNGYDAAASVIETVMVTAYICPSSVRAKQFENGSATIYTTHYYGIMGPKGTNAATGGTYGWDNSQTGHGGFATGGVLLRRDSMGFRDVLDGTSNTFIVGESSFSRTLDGLDNWSYRKWIRGCNTNTAGVTKNILDGINVTRYNGSNNFNDVSFGSEHPGGCLFVRCDASVTFVSQNVDLAVYKATASRDGGESEVVK